MSPTPYAPRNIGKIIDALPAQSLADLCNSFLHYTVDASDVQALRYTLREGFERELIDGCNIIGEYDAVCLAHDVMEAA
jgi:hypothetical protein